MTRLPARSPAYLLSLTLLAVAACGGGDSKTGGTGGGGTPTEPAVKVTLKVELTGDGAGTVTSTPAGISCATGATTGCSAEFDQGTSVSFAQAATGANVVFTGWSGPCTGTGTCSFTVSSAATVKAGFDDNTLTRETIGASGGTITSPSGNLEMSIPAGALSGDKEITITPVDASTLTGDLATLGAALGVTQAYTFEPDGTQFAQPVTIKVKTGTTVDAQSGKLSTGLLLLTSGSTTGLPDDQTISVDPETGALSLEGHISHFSKLVATGSGKTFGTELQPGYFTATTNTSYQVHLQAYEQYDPALVTGDNPVLVPSASSLCYEDGGSTFPTPAFDGCQALTAPSSPDGRWSTVVPYSCSQEGPGIVRGRLRLTVADRVMLQNWAARLSCEAIPAATYGVDLALQGAGTGKVAFSSNVGSPEYLCDKTSADPMNCSYRFQALSELSPTVTLDFQPGAGFQVGNVIGATPGTVPNVFTIQLPTTARIGNVTASLAQQTASFGGGVTISGPGSGSVIITSDAVPGSGDCSKTNADPVYCTFIFDAAVDATPVVRYTFTLNSPSSYRIYQVTGAQPTADPRIFQTTLSASQRFANSTVQYAFQAPQVSQIDSYFPYAPYTTSYSVQASDPAGGALTYSWSMSGEPCGTPKVPWTQDGYRVTWSHSDMAPDNCTHMGTDHAVTATVVVQSPVSQFAVQCSINGSETQIIPYPSCTEAASGAPASASSRGSDFAARWSGPGLEEILRRAEGARRPSNRPPPLR